MIRKCWLTSLLSGNCYSLGRQGSAVPVPGSALLKQVVGCSTNTGDSTNTPPSVCSTLDGQVVIESSGLKRPERGGSEGAPSKTDPYGGTSAGTLTAKTLQTSSGEHALRLIMPVFTAPESISRGVFRFLPLGVVYSSTPLARRNASFRLLKAEKQLRGHTEKRVLPVLQKRVRLDPRWYCGCGIASSSSDTLRRAVLHAVGRVTPFLGQYPGLTFGGFPLADHQSDRSAGGPMAVSSP